MKAVDLLADAEGQAFVGRRRELTELAEALEHVRVGRGRLVMVAGEPGIGKSRLADVFSGHVRALGIPVAYGHCWESGGAPPYRPWTQVIRKLLQDGVATGQVLEDPLLPYLKHLVPELDRLVPGIEPAPPLEGESARAALFDGVAGFLRNVAASGAVLVVVEDLHAADSPSLLLLRYLAGEIPHMPLFLLGSYRDVDARLNPAVAPLLFDLSEASRVTLRGLSEEDVRRLIELQTRTTATDELLSTVVEKTAGNPFFVGEIARMLAPSRGYPTRALPDAAQVPDEVREAIRKRLRHLSEDARSAIAAAAVLGRSFTVPLLSRMLARQPAELLDSLAEATETGILEREAERRERYGFRHTLFRDTLYQDLLTPQRIELHARAATVIEEMYGDDEAWVAQLAHHYLEAAAGGGLDKAITYGIRAAESAGAVYAFEEAAMHYDRTLRTLELADDVDEVLKCEVILGLGQVYAKAGNVERARESFDRAAAIARRLNAPILFGRVALGFAGIGIFPSGPAVAEASVVAIVEEAIDRVGTGDSTLGASLRARLAMELYWTDRSVDREANAAEAIAMARRIGDDRTLALCLVMTSVARWDLEIGGVDAETIAEVMSLAERLQDRELLLVGHVSRLRRLLEFGDLQEIQRERAAIRRLADELRQPLFRWYDLLYASQAAQWAGDFDLAERRNREAYEVGLRANPANAEATFFGLLVAMRWIQGRLGELRAKIAGITAEPAHAWRAALALADAQGGDRAAAAGALDRFRAGGFSFRRDIYWPTTMAVLADVCSEVSDGAAAAALYEMLLPSAGRFVVAGRTGSIFLGSTSLSLGVLARTAGRFKEARAHLEEALRMHEAIQDRPYVARVSIELAEVLAEAGEDTDRSAILAEEGIRLAEEMRLEWLVRRGRALIDGIPRIDGEAEPAAPVTIASMRKEGAYWRITYGDRSFLLRDSKGLQYLSALLRHPGVESHVLQLASPGGPTDRLPKRHDSEGWDGENAEGDDVLDRRAIDAYRQRLEALREERDEAAELGDVERAERAGTEMEFLTDQLSSALGLGGRSRTATSLAERARWAVTKNIRGAIGKIAEQAPELGGHLGASISTGIFCSYRPDPSSRISWDL